MSEIIEEYINEQLEDYKIFMDIDDFPIFSTTIIRKEQYYTSGAYPSIAKHYYDVDEKTHNLSIYEFLYDKKLNASNILFHEFTHMYDVNKHVTNGKCQYGLLKGYMEYHATQIDTLKLLGMKNIKNISPFSINYNVNVLGEKEKIVDYLKDIALLAKKI